MSNNVDAIITAERRISVFINMALSAAFFLLMFGVTPKLLAWGAPDNFAFDFIPQSLAIGFFSAFVPAILISRKRAKGLIEGVDDFAPRMPVTFFRALCFAGAAGLIAIVIAWSIPLVASHVGYFAALGMKVIYGGALAAVITPKSVRMALK